MDGLIGRYTVPSINNPAICAITVGFEYNARADRECGPGVLILYRRRAH